VSFFVVGVSGTTVAVSVGAGGVSVSVTCGVSVTVGLLVKVGLGDAVSVGVNVGGGSLVGVKVDLIWKGVFVDVPFSVYFCDVGN
jgi:hypothetical protein